jgi:hypothetical protein|uniref:Uncharacterized protein n=1 Tax=viral metagenome TaxID=1070528 RepID=A0A6C0LNZ1_9ZZZZ
MTKLGHGTRKYRPAAAFKVKLTKRNVKHMLSRNANVIPTRYGLAIKRLAPMVSKVERIVENDGDIISDLQADLSIHLGKIRQSCEKALERHKEEAVMNNNNMMGNSGTKAGNNVSNANLKKLQRMINRNAAKKQKNAGVNDLLASFGSLKF